MASRILEPLVSRQLLSHKSPFCNSLDGTLVCDHSDESYQAAFQVLYLAYTSVDKTLLRLASMLPFKWKLDIFQLKWLVCLFKYFTIQKVMKVGFFGRFFCVGNLLVHVTCYHLEVMSGQFLYSQTCIIFSVYFLHRPSAFEIPYTFNIHESPVTCTQFCSECPREFIMSLESTASSRTRKRQLQRGDSVRVRTESGVFSV